MAYVIEGTAYWAKVYPEIAQDDRYSLEVGQLKDPAITQLKALGIPVKQDTKEGPFNKGNFVPMWQYLKSQKGEINKLPVVDLDNKPITSLIGNGSLVNVEFKDKDWTMKHEQTGKVMKTGKRAALMAVQVAKLVTFGDRPAAPGSSFAKSSQAIEEDEVPFDMVGGE